MSAKPNISEAQLSPVTGAQVLVRTLEDAGVEIVFGFPGGTIMPVYDALYDSHLKHILCRHEQGVALAADGYARASSKLGVCIATSGPGATSLVTGIAGMTIDKATEIESGLNFLRQTQGPCLLHVKIDRRHNVWPLVPPGQSNQIMLENTA